VDAVLAVDQDRLARRMTELSEFLELCGDRKVPIVLLSGELDTTTADGVLRAHILGAVAQNESAKKSERVKRQRDQAARTGEGSVGGRRPYGFEAGGMQHRPVEVKVIRDVARRLLAGESLRAVVADLNDRGIAAPAGGAWSSTQLRAMIIKPRLAGIRIHRGEAIGAAPWKAILSEDEHRRLVRLFRARAGRKGRPATSLLGGIARCGRCGTTMWHACQAGRRLYRCPDKTDRGCNGVTISAEPLEELVAAAVAYRVASPAVAGAARVEADRAAMPDDDLALIEADLEAVAEKFGRGLLSEREWSAAREPLLLRRDAATRRAGAPDMSALAKVRDWDELDVGDRRTILQLLLEAVTVGPGRRGAKGFDADRVNVAWRA
jgi:hypothetical protein